MKRTLTSFPVSVPGATSLALLAAGGLALFGLGGCDHHITGPAPRVTLEIQGTVRSAITAVPVSGAEVEVWYCPSLFCLNAYSLLTSASTDGAGRYTLIVPGASLIGPRCYWAAAVSVRAQGFVEYEVLSPDQLPIQCVQEPQALDFQLTPAPE